LRSRAPIWYESCQSDTPKSSAVSVVSNAPVHSTRRVPPGVASGSVRGLTLTKTWPAPTATSSGPAPTGIVATTSSVFGSIRDTVPSPLLATQTAPAPTATPMGDLPTAIVFWTDPVRGSMRTSELSSASVTQTAPAPTLTSVGTFPTGIAVVAPLEPSTRVTVFASSPTTQTVPSSLTARSVG
jgi:hypothetical protein